MRFKDKTILVTGGTSGLGEMAVKAFAGEGATVFFCGLIDEEGARVAQEVNAADLQGHAIYCHADVRSDAAVKAFVLKAYSAYDRLDAAFNNAGISHHAARFPDQSMDMVEDVMRTNVMGVWHAMRHQLPLMDAAGAGAIVNTSSILSKSGAAWMAAYGASKHAIVGLTKSAALDYADRGIRINAISPGPMQTPMFDRALKDIDGDMSKFAGGMPATGPADPADVARTVLYLCSEEAAGMTGHNMIVDGGASSR